MRVASMHGIWCFYKRDLTRDPLPLPSCEDTESAIYELGRGSWPEHNQAGNLILNSQSPDDDSNLFISHQICGILL